MTEARPRALMVPDVSRETLGRLETYSDLLLTWQRKINLVSKTTVKDRWRRHIEDSLQFVSLIPEASTSVVDLGSGAGFPGLVCAIALAERTDPSTVSLIESDQRKCAFLREVSRQTQTNVSIVAQRAEEVTDLEAQIVTARALAPLSDLLTLAQPFLRQNGRCLFSKGTQYEAELEKAQDQWQFTYEVWQSAIAPDSVILDISELSRASP